MVSKRDRDAKRDVDDVDDVKEDGEIDDNKMIEEVQVSKDTNSNTSNSQSNTNNISNVNNKEKERKKNLFGSILGHLSKARKNLDKDKDIIEKQQLLKSKAEQRNAEMAERINAMNKEKKAAEKMELLIKKKESVPMNTETWMNTHVEKMRSTLVTTFQPSLQWSPRAHNDTTNKLLDNRANEIEKMIRNRLIDDKIKIENIEREIENLHKSNSAANTSNDDNNKNNETKTNEESNNTDDNNKNDETEESSTSKRQKIDTRETLDGTIVDYDDE